MLVSDLQANYEEVPEGTTIYVIDDEGVWTNAFWQPTWMASVGRALYGDNVRVLRWILDRCKGDGQATKTAIGYVPAPGALDLRGLEEDVTPPVLEELFRIDKDDWKAELESQKEFFAKFGDHCPKEIWNQYEATAQRVGL